MKTIWKRFTDGFTLKKITWIVLGAAICSFGIYNLINRQELLKEACLA